jgi:hypothetical protein
MLGKPLLSFLIRENNLPEVLWKDSPQVRLAPGPSSSFGEECVALSVATGRGAAAGGSVARWFP